MAKIDKSYHKLINQILSDGFLYEDPNRKGVRRIQIPSYKFEHSFKDGFPAITTKKLYWKGIVGELIWFLRGDTNIKYLLDNKIHIWDKDAYNHFLKDKPELTKCTSPNKCINIPFDINNETHKDLFLGNVLQGNDGFGGLGKIYGGQWRNWTNFVGNNGNALYYNNVDQFQNLIQGLKDNPMSTQHIVTAWNPAELDKMALPPCHWSFEILVEPLPDNRLKKYSENIMYEHSNLLDGIEYQFTLKWH